MKILVTGAAGFIGSFVVERLLKANHQVVGLDSINDYYDVNVKYGRLAKVGLDRELIEPDQKLVSHLFPAYQFIKTDLKDRANLDHLFKTEKFDQVVHLAAQAGVRYSLENPQAYIDSNIIGFFNILDNCRSHQIKHLVYASSSSVYGLNEKMPFSTSDNVDHPVSLYAASKKSNELMAHSYSHLFKIPTTGLRFFTVYGPWGRPDMALFLFTKAIIEGKPITVFNHGKMRRDFTYVTDIVEGIIRVLGNPPTGNPDWQATQPDPASSPAPYKIYNIGNNKTVELTDFISAIEDELGIKAIKNLMPLQPGDVPATWANIDQLEQEQNYRPATDIRTGIKQFIHWYKQFYSEN